MNKPLLKYVENNWDQLKEKIQQQWNKLTDDDVSQIEGSYEKLLSKLKKIYTTKTDEIENEILEFLYGEKLAYEAQKDRYSYEAASFKEALNDRFENYLNYIKNTSSTLGTSTKDHIRHNPTKWLGIAALSGFVLAKIIRL